MMTKTWRWVLGVAVVIPSAWAERDKKPTKPPAGGPGNGLKPPPGKPQGEPRAGTGAMVKLDGGTFTMGSNSNLRSLRRVACFREKARTSTSTSMSTSIPTGAGKM
jgi:hypothetical protein